jgi:hypothetical protein
MVLQKHLFFYEWANQKMGVDFASVQQEKFLPEKSEFMRIKWTGNPGNE